MPVTTGGAGKAAMVEQQTSRTFWLEFSRQHLDEVHLLLDRYRRADECYRDGIVERIIKILQPLIRHTAAANLRHRPGTSHSLDDFVVFVELAVFKAVRSYDPTRNDNFFGYLFTVCNNEIIKLVQSEITVPRNLFRSMTSERMRNLAADDPLHAVYQLLHTEQLALSDYQRVGACSGIDVDGIDREYVAESDGQMVLEDLL